jgi:hypothetical protein
VVHTLQKLYTKSKALRTLLGHFIALCKEKGISLTATYIDSLSNAVADVLSRSVNSHSVALAPTVFTVLQAIFPSFEALSFSPARLRALPRVPTLLQPPWHHIPALLHQLSETTAPAVVVLPFWPS